MICPACDCGCLILPYKCLEEKNSNLRRLKLSDRPEILNAVNSFILIGANTTGGILGEVCFNQLCENIKTANALAEEYRIANPGVSNEQTEFWYYLAEKWYKLLKNGYFQSMYAAYCLYYYYDFGIAQSETTLDGDVIHNRPGSGNDGEASQNIDLETLKLKTSKHLGIAKNYAAIFKNNFLQNNLSLYPCLNICGCGNINCDGCQIPNKDGTPKKIGRKPRPTAL